MRDVIGCEDVCRKVQRLLCKQIPCEQSLLRSSQISREEERDCELPSLRTQIYFRLSLVPPKITVTEPEPEKGSVCWSWVPSRGSRVPSRGSWIPSRGSWIPTRGSWVIDWEGSALARRRFFGIPSISKQTLSSLQQQIIHGWIVLVREKSSVNKRACRK